MRNSRPPLLVPTAVPEATEQNRGAPWVRVGCRNECATPQPRLCPSAKSFCHQQVAGRGGQARALCSFAASHHHRKVWGRFFSSFLCLSARALVTFLVSPYHDLSTQHIVLFLVSRFIVCHSSVLALEPVSPRYTPESLVTQQALLLISRCADSYHPDGLEILPGARGQTESWLGLPPRNTRGDLRSSSGVCSHLRRGQRGRDARVGSPCGAMSIPQPGPGRGQAFIPRGIDPAVVFAQRCPHSQIKTPGGFASLCRSRDFAGG